MAYEVQIAGETYPLASTQGWAQLCRAIGTSPNRDNLPALNDLVDDNHTSSSASLLADTLVAIKTIDLSPELKGLLKDLKDSLANHQDEDGSVLVTDGFSSEGSDDQDEWYPSEY